MTENFSKLPNVLINYIFGFLHVRDLFNLDITCKSFQQFIYQKELFKPFYIKMMGEFQKGNNESVDWKKLYSKAIRETSISSKKISI